jgi:hypothetical protein
LRLYEELFAECIKWIDVGIRERFLDEGVGIDGGIPLSKMPEFSS